MVKETDHRFLHYLCETFRKNPDDPFIEEMDPFVKSWWYHSWANKIENDLEAYKSVAILIGSFSNPEMAQKIIKKERPDIESSDEDFDASFEMVRQSVKEEESIKNNKHRRKRRLIKE